MGKYAQYELIDFAEDDSFINWVNNENVNDINFWNKWILDNPDKKDLLSEAKTLVKSLNFAHEPITSEAEDRTWKKISRSIDGSQTDTISKSKPGLKVWLPLTIAASLALLLFNILPLSSAYDSSVITGLAEDQQISLPDQSIVDINSGSLVKYDSESWLDNREVYLEGEAFFSVKKGSTFTVSTPNGNVEVLGTSFNVYSRNDVLQVQCESGKVRVKKNSQEYILTPDESITLSAASVNSTAKKINAKRSTWRRGLYQYEDASVRTVLQDLERQYDINITGEEKYSDLKYTGKFYSTNVDTALYQVTWPLNLSVTEKDGIYIVNDLNE